MRWIGFARLHRYAQQEKCRSECRKDASGRTESALEGSWEPGAFREASKWYSDISERPFLGSERLGGISGRVFGGIQRERLGRDRGMVDGMSIRLSGKETANLIAGPLVLSGLVQILVPECP